MPNHVTTRCNVGGPDASIEEFRERAFCHQDGEPVFDFNAFVPMPKDVEETQYTDQSGQWCGPHGFPAWYNWSVKNWGTKWNAYRFRVVTERPLEFVFHTAWSFPLPVFRAIARAFPQLSFRCSCFDEGWVFAGDGYFNPVPGQSGFALCDTSSELHERVYGYAPQTEGGAA